MALRKTFLTDKKLEADGVEIPVAINEYNGEPVLIHISRMGTVNKRYTKALDAATKPHQSAIQNGSMDNDLARKLVMSVFADTVILGWSNLPKSDLTGNDLEWAAQAPGREPDKEELEFTKENVLALFDLMPDLYDDWEKRAQGAASFRQAALETNQGNSSAS